MLKKPAEQAHNVNVSPLRDESDPFAEPGADLVREIASTAAEGEHPQVVVFERSVLDQRQEPVLGAPVIESVYARRECAFGFSQAVVRRSATTVVGRARVS